MGFVDPSGLTEVEAAIISDTTTYDLNTNSFVGGDENFDWSSNDSDSGNTNKPAEKKQYMEVGVLKPGIDLTAFKPTMTITEKIFYNFFESAAILFNGLKNGWDTPYVDFYGEVHGIGEAKIQALTTFLDVAMFGVVGLGAASTFVENAIAAGKGPTTVIGRVKDLQNLSPGEKSLLDRLPDMGSPKANWKQNSGVLREEMGKGKPILDKSPGDNSGQFLNAERNLLKSRGWTFDSTTNFWNPMGQP